MVVITYRAVDLMPGDVIRIRERLEYIWVEVQAVYVGKEGAEELRKLAAQVRLDYKTKKAPNIGTALFIEGHGDGTVSGGRLAQIESGLSVAVKSRVHMESYDEGNWREFRSLALVDMQKRD